MKRWWIPFAVIAVIVLGIYALIEVYSSFYQVEFMGEIPPPSMYALDVRAVLRGDELEVVCEIVLHSADAVLPADLRIESLEVFSASAPPSVSNSDFQGKSTVKLLDGGHLPKLNLETSPVIWKVVLPAPKDKWPLYVQLSVVSDNGAGSETLGSITPVTKQD